jgi:glycosyltransferase involved in cell wall biosynthesis
MAAQPTFGGGERHVADLAAGLRARGWEAVVLVPGEGALAERLRHDGVPVRSLPRPARAADFPGAAVALARLVRREGFALVHGHSGYPNLMVRLAGRATGVPAVVTWHGLHFLHAQGLRGRAYVAAEKSLAGLAAAHVFVCEADLRVYKARVLGRHRALCARVYNGVSLPAAVPPAPLPGARLVTVARFHRQKDYPTLFAAVAQLAGRFPALTLDCYGFGPEAGALAALAARHGVAARVNFQNVPHAELMRRYAHYDAFVLASRWEGLPYAVLEALSCGVPVAASDVGGVGELLEPGRNGVLVPPGDAGALAAAVAQILAAPARYHTGVADALPRLRERFTLPAMLSGVEAVYRRVLA